MSTLTSPSAVTVGSLTFGYVDDTTLTGFVYTNLEGWYDGPEVRTNFTARPYANGSFDAPVFRGVRTITLTGTYVGADHGSSLQAAQQLTALLGDGSVGSVTVDSITAAVRLSAPPLLSWLGGLDFAFQVSFTAVDPKKYGPTTTVGPYVLAAATGGLIFPLFMPSGVLSWGTLPTPQTLTLNNPGTAEAPVVLTVAANGAALTGGFQILEQTTGRALRFVDNLAAGDIVVFDSGAGTVVIDGTADRRGSLSVAQWTPVPALSARTFYLAPLGGANTTASLTASMRPAYW